jgi:molecular chaperone DnaJ
MSSRTRPAPKDYYALLGVPPTASPAELRRAYRQRARRLHPDVNRAPDAAARFAALTEAYETLSDPARRAAYDAVRTGMADRAAWNGTGTHGVARRNGHSAAAPPAEPSVRGLDVHQTVRLSLREAAFGVDKTIAVPRREVCPTCRGTGAAPGATVRQCGRCHGTGRGHERGQECRHCRGNGVIPSVPCATCGGAGRLEDVSEFPLRFPPAVEDDEVLRIKNEGDAGPQGGPRGDLHLHVEVEPDPVLRRRGSEVYADVTITPEEAARGGRIEVPTLHGSAHLRLPRGVADGARFVMRHKGLRLKGRWLRGDQHVTVHVAGREHPQEDERSHG